VESSGAEGSGSSAGDGASGAVETSGTEVDGSACGDGIAVPGVLCWIEVPLTWPEELSFNILRPFDDGRVLIAGQNGSNVAILDTMANGPIVGPVVSTTSAEFDHTIRWGLPLQLDADPAVEVVTSDYDEFVLYETTSATLSVTAMGSSFPGGPADGYMFVAIDVDRDGIDEIVRANRGPLAVWRLDPAGTWAQVSDSLPQPPCHALNLAVADFDGDARDDLVVLGNHGYGQHPSNGEEFCPNYEEAFDDMYILLNRYEEQGMAAPFELVLGPEITLPTVPQLPAAPTLVPSDYNGDGMTDLFIDRGGDFQGELPLFIRGLGDGTFASPLELQLPMHRAVAGDFDGDGSVEIIADASRAVGPDGLWIWGGSGVEWLPVAVESVPGTIIGPMVASDMNRDGVSDLLLAGGYLLISNP